MTKLKELLKDHYINDNSIKTHVVVNGIDRGITGFYTREYLLANYGECDAEIEEYEKDYGDGEIAIRSFLAVHVSEGQ